MLAHENITKGGYIDKWMSVCWQSEDIKNLAALSFNVLIKSLKQYNFGLLDSVTVKWPMGLWTFPFCFIPGCCTWPMQ